MNKLLLMGTLMGSLYASCIEMTPSKNISLTTLYMLQQDLGKNEHILPFNCDFNWNELKKESVVINALERLKDRSIYDMLDLWKNSLTLRADSMHIIALLNRDIMDLKFEIKKEHMKEIITELNTLWQDIFFS